MNKDDNIKPKKTRLLVEFYDSEIDALADQIVIGISSDGHRQLKTAERLRTFLYRHGVEKKDYSYKLTRGLVDVLIRMADYVKEMDGSQYFRIKDLNLANHQYTQVTKLRLHALVAKRRGPDGKHTGEWVITRRGWGFLAGRIQLHESVSSHENKVKERFGPMITVDMVLQDAWKVYLEQVKDFAFETVMYESQAPTSDFYELEID